MAKSTDRTLSSFVSFASQNEDRARSHFQVLSRTMNVM